MSNGSATVAPDTAQITIKSRVAELLMASRRFEEMNNRLNKTLATANLFGEQPPSDKEEVAKDGPLPEVLTEAVVTMNEQLARYEKLVEAVSTQLT